MARSSTAAIPLQSLCFHCGLPIAPGWELQVRVEGTLQPVCCPGCQAIVLSITDRGLEAYYRLRSDAATSDAAASDAATSAAQKAGGGRPELSLYDEPAV